MSRPLSSSIGGLSKDALDHLNDAHRTLLIHYIKFLKSRGGQSLKDTVGQIDDLKETRLVEGEMYSYDEVMQIMDGMKDLLKSNIAEDSEKLSKQQALFLRLLLLSAEGYGVSLSVDTAQLDDSVLLDWLKKFELDSGKKELSEAPSAKRLPSVTGTVDVKLVTKIKDLEDANRSALNRFDKLQHQAMAAMKENTELKEKLAFAEQEAKQHKFDLENIKRGNDDAQQEEIDRLRLEIKKLKEESIMTRQKADADIKAAKEALENKVNASPQFQQLKKMLTQKNQQLKDSRDKLKQYEADSK